jgi:hypothetical protein
MGLREVAMTKLIGEKPRPQLTAGRILGREARSGSPHVNHERPPALHPRVVPFQNLDREVRGVEALHGYGVARFLRYRLRFTDIEREHALTPNDISNPPCQITETGSADESVSV